MNDSKIIFNDVSIGFKKATVIKPINMSLEFGQIYGLIGDNGSGKTTLLKTIMGYLQPLQGQIIIDESPSGKYDRYGYMPDATASYQNLSAYENLLVRSVEWGLDYSNINDLLKKIGLDGCGSKKVKKFSYGMKRRLDFGVSILSEPRILLLDEPLNGIDPTGVRDFINLIKAFADHTSKCVIISSHNIEELKKLCSSFLLIKNKGLYQYSDSGQAIESLFGESNV